MLQILAHSNLSHQFILVSVHSSQLTHVSKYVLQPISKLVCIYIVESVLYMTVNDQLGESENFSAQVEGITKSRLLTFFRC